MSSTTKLKVIKPNPNMGDELKVEFESLKGLVEKHIAVSKLYFEKLEALLLTLKNEVIEPLKHDIWGTNGTPGIKTEQDRQKAWIENQKESLKEARQFRIGILSGIALLFLERILSYINVLPK